MELQAGDILKINSNIKSWLYSDMLEKPEELVMNRPRNKGGLGVQNVKIKAQALLIKSFLETVINPEYIKNFFHNALYRWHVLEDFSISDPGNTPYYSQTFFSTIKQVVQEGLLNIPRMTTKQWYQVLLENFPDVDWDRTWDFTKLVFSSNYSTISCPQLQDSTDSTRDQLQHVQCVHLVPSKIGSTHY